MDTLAEMIPAYEQARFGTIAQSDSRWPFARFANWARAIFDGEKRPPAEPGEILLVFLVACKRQGYTLEQVLHQAAECAAYAVTEAEELAAAGVKGGPMPDEVA